MTIYVDTGAWIALLDQRDSYHETARLAHTALRQSNESIVTGWHTLVELADGLARHAGQARASQAVASILASPNVRVEGSEPHREAALELFNTHLDWGIDLSDCLSFAMMRELGVTRAFGFDRDFLKAGFDLVPRP